MLGVAKRVILKSIEELSSSTQFALVFGGPTHGSFTRFPKSGKPVEATSENKQRAAAFLSTAPVDGTPSVALDLITALRSAEQIPSNRRTIIYVGRGIITDDTPENVLNVVAAENRLRVKISVIGIEPFADGEEFLKALAEQNGGTYTRVN